MRLITHNMLQCRAKGVVDGYPLRIVCNSMEVIGTEFDRETVLKTLRRINFAALKKAARDLNIAGIPDDMAAFPFPSSSPSSSSSSAIASSKGGSAEVSSAEESVFTAHSSGSISDSKNDSNLSKSSNSGDGSNNNSNSDISSDINNNGKVGGDSSSSGSSSDSSSSSPVAAVDIEATLKVLHHLLFEVHVISGALVCPSSGRSFPIVDSIPNMLLHEDEV